jgi:hypothetical protein
MAIVWTSEACDLRPDPVSGAAITRLTNAALHSTNFYYEQPYGTPDGRRIAFGRSQHCDPRFPPNQLWVADLERLRISFIDDDIVSTWFATFSWGGIVHYLRRNGELIRVNLTTLEREIVITHWPLPLKAILWSVTPDLRYLVTALNTHDFHTEILKVDLTTGRYTTVYRQRCILGHIQINHVNGRDLLVQVNADLCGNHLGEQRRLNDPVDLPPHVVIDLETGELKPLKIGPPHTGVSLGHASWIADTGRMVTPVAWPGMRVDFWRDEDRPPHDPRHPQGNLVIVGPQDAAPTIFPAPTHLFDHSSASRCGRYFVADCVCHGVPGKIEVVIGCFASGKCRVLLSDCGAEMGGPASSHVHPYLTADNAHVIYNADPKGLGQVHKARLPDGFLASLH